MFARVPYVLRVASTLACGALIPPAVAVVIFWSKSEICVGSYKASWGMEVEDSCVKSEAIGKKE